MMRNSELIETIRTLRSAHKETGKAIWKALADELDRANRRRVVVNLSRIDRYTEEGQIVAVPGKVLASGSLGHSVTVAAFAFSEMAVRKLEMANGRAMRLGDLLKDGVEPSKIKIIK